MPIFQRRAMLSSLAFETGELECHTLIQVFLRGGADTLNFFAPLADDRYLRLRPSLALKPPGAAADAAIALDERYGMHPALRPLEGAFKDGRLGVVQAVSVDNTSGSHFDCQDQMEHGDSLHGPPAGGGWLGRFLRLRSDAGESALSAVAIGTALPESLRGAPAVSVLEHLRDISLHASAADPARTLAALQALYGADVTLLGKRGLETLDLFRRVEALQGGAAEPEHGAAYPKDPFGSGMSEIARLIKARVGLRVACIDLGGWDTHIFQGGATGPQAERIRILAEGIAALELDLKDHSSRYTLMVTTEFGRRVYENASFGTDHGRSFALMALGDRVKGGRILGGWPLRLDNEVNLNTPGPGGLLMETDCRNVFAEILHGSQGLSPAQTAQLFPGLEVQALGLM